MYVCMYVCVQVNTLEQGKTAVHVAVEESRLKVLEVVLKFKPDLSIMVGVLYHAVLSCVTFVIATTVHCGLHIVL